MTGAGIGMAEGGARRDTSRWLILAVVVAAQFMFGVDAFIVNVALPTIAAELKSTPSAIEATVSLYLVAYAALVVTGGRLGDIHGARRVFLAGVLGFTLASLWCGLARSASELILARFVQGATAALMVPQVLATLHVLFPDEARARAFAVYGIVLGLAGATGFLLGGVLVSFDVSGWGWRTVFFVNVPFGLVILAAAARLMPSPPRRAGTRLDLPGTGLLVAGLLCIVGSVSFGHDLNWDGRFWGLLLAGLAALMLFVPLEKRVGARGGMPLVDLSLFADRGFQFGLCATFFFFAGNLSFYFVLTMFMQTALAYSPLQAGLTVLPLAAAFVIATRHAARRSARRGALVLIEGCAVQFAGLIVTAASLAILPNPPALAVALAVAVFGYGQGLVMAPLSSAVLSSVRPQAAGSGSGLYGTTTQVANAVGVAVIGSAYFTLAAVAGPRPALWGASTLLAGALLACALLLHRMISARSPAS